MALMVSPESEPWRLILSPPDRGAENMALDEAILDAVSAGDSPPTLRLFAWHPPCLSLGYSQPIADVDQHHLHERRWDIVRRPTGGRAILHTDELTYSVIVSDDNPHVAGGVLEGYRRLSLGLEAALTLLGLEVKVQPEILIPKNRRENPTCFLVPSPYEILVRGKKLIGSAQVRRRGGVLQHGTLPLSGDISRIYQVLLFNDETARKSAAQLLLERATTVEAMLGTTVSWQQAAQAFVEGFTNGLNLRLDPGSTTDQERTRADQLIKNRYDNPDWTERI